MGKRMYILDCPSANRKEFVELSTKLRPLARQFDFVLTNLKVRSVSLEDLKSWHEAMLKEIDKRISEQQKATEKEEKSKPPMTPERKEMLSKMKGKVLKELSEDGQQTQAKAKAKPAIPEVQR